MSMKLAEEWFGAFDTKSVDQLEGLLAEEFVHTSPFGTVSGRDAYIDMVRANAEAFFSPAIDVVDMIEDGEKTAVRYRINGNPACDCIYARDGKIAEIFAYFHYGEKPMM